MKATDGRKKETTITIMADKWLWGSTATELTLVEQAIFMKLLCKGGSSLGIIDITYPETLAARLLVPLEELLSTLEKAERFGKTKVYTVENGSRRLARFTKWNRYQHPYLHNDEDDGDE